MNELQRLMKENRWTLRGLTEALGCTRYLLKHVVEHEPETQIQRNLYQQAVEFLSPPKIPGTSRAQVSREGIPVLGDIPAGPLNLVEGTNNAEDFIQFADLDPKQHFAVRVHGSSMEPAYVKGDLVICKRIEGVAMPMKNAGPTPVHKFLRYDGRVVCGLIDGEETTLKKLEIVKSSTSDVDYLIRLTPLNPKHPTIEVKDSNAFSIQGEAVRLVRDL